MSKENRSYPKEFREEAVNLAIKSPSIMQAARELGIPDATLYAWVKKLKGSTANPKQDAGSQCDVNISVLLEENRRLQKQKVKTDKVDSDIRALFFLHKKRYGAPRIATELQAKGVIVHTDRGIQYCSAAYQAIIRWYGLACSMSRVRDCWDNAVAESLFHTLKTELIYVNCYTTRDEAKQSIFAYTEMYYNRFRRHSRIGSLAPCVFEEQYQFVP